MKPKARIITLAWGDSYVDQLMELTLPALLAPGNLPAIASIFDCEFVLVTESRFFEKIRHSSVFKSLEGYCSIRLVELDDVISNGAGYGLLLTLAFYRGFADLGEKMKEYFLIFFNADFIIGDGSFQTLSQRIIAGERLIFAPSYCVVLEEVLSILSDKVEPKTGRLVIPRRDMAALILAHRHNTIKAKTVNQRLFHMPYIEQFYWHVDDQTLLGHQMPIALVCMMPERVLTEIHTFWDYGIVSEACPTTKPCVLGDSDDFLMMELRPKKVAQDQLALGWPSSKYIANKISEFITKDQIDMGLYPLVLHSGEIPESARNAKEQLREFVRGVYQFLPAKPWDHLNHKMWDYHCRRFAEASVPHDRVPNENVQKPFLFFLTRFSQNFIGYLEWYYRILVGRPPFITRLHPFYSILTPTLELLRPELSKPKQRILLLSFDSGYISNFVRSFPAARHLIFDASLDLGNRDQIALRVSSKSELSKFEEGNTGPSSLNEFFDLCVCEVNLSEFLQFGEILKILFPKMGRGGRIVVFHQNKNMLPLYYFQHEFIEKSTSTVGESHMIFSGSVWTKWALKFHNFGATLTNRYGLWGSLALAGLVVCAIPLSVIGNWVSERRSQRTMPESCLSLTMEYKVQ